MTLFDDEVGRQVSRGPEGGRPGAEPASAAVPAARVVRVVPDVPAMDRVLDYSVPEHLAGRLDVGSVVRVPLHGRRVRGWVVGPGPGAGAPEHLEEVAHLTGMGPDAEVIDLCRWAAWRWAGRLPSLLRFATPERAVTSRAARTPEPPRVSPSGPGGLDALAAEMLARGPGVHVLTVSPTTDPAPFALAAAAMGQALVLAPQVRTANHLARSLSRAGSTVARWPEGFSLAAAGHNVVGGRTAVWAPLPALAAVVVIDEHDETLQNESSPTWHAREVAMERGRRAGVPVLLVSPCPSLEALDAAAVDGAPTAHVVLDAGLRRAGWPALNVVDRRNDDPRTGLFSSAFVESARASRDAGEAVVCVHNRKGRARLLACRSCSSVAECEECSAAVHTATGPGAEVLECPRCASQRPLVCLDCGGSGFKVLRAGVTRAAEELEALLGEPVAAVSASGPDPAGPAPLLLGTEAVLHRARRLARTEVGLVAFLDFDQELLAPRYRAAEEAMALLLAGARLARGRGGASMLVQTRKPGHPVLEAAMRADPAMLVAAERARRELLGLPPAASVAAVGGEAAGEWIERLGHRDGIEVTGPRDGWWLVRGADPSALADACASVRRPPGRLRLRVDPVRLP